jgi:hypothetical protein
VKDSFCTFHGVANIVRDIRAAAVNGLGVRDIQPAGSTDRNDADDNLGSGNDTDRLVVVAAVACNVVGVGENLHVVVGEGSCLRGERNMAAQTNPSILVQ